jgi:hypothetical protein
MSEEYSVLIFYEKSAKEKHPQIDMTFTIYSIMGAQ